MRITLTKIAKAMGISLEKLKQPISEEEYKGDDAHFSIPLIHSQEELDDTLAHIHSMNILHKLEDEK